MFRGATRASPDTTHSRHQPREVLAMLKSFLRFRRVSTALVVVGCAALSGCEDGFFAAPADTPAQLNVAYRVTSNASDPASAFDKADHVRVRVTGPGIAVDTVVGFGPSEEARVRIAIVKPTGDAQHEVQVDVMRSTDVLFHGSTTIAIPEGRTTTAEVLLTPVLAAVALPDSVPTFTSIGDTAFISGAVVFATGDSMAGLPVSWLSTDPSVVTVDASGRIIARGEGTALIRATHEGLTADIPVRVAAAVASIRITPGADTLFTTQIVQLNAAAFDRRGNAIARTFLWQSAEPTRVSVTTAGVATAIDSGHIAVTARTSDGASGSAQLYVPGASPKAANALGVGTRHTCAIDENAQVWCWGREAIGFVESPESSVPVALPGSLLFHQVSAGTSSCGVTYGGQAYCWGQGVFGQLGDGTNITSILPVAVSGGIRFTTVQNGFDHTCGLAVDSTAYCWGGNRNGQLGTGDTVSVNVPKAVSGGIRFRSISTGLLSTCALSTTGQAYCWGWNALRQTGTGSTAGNVFVPTPVNTGLAFTSLTAGPSVSCAVADGGAGYCWGTNQFGTLGQGSTSNGQVVTTPGGLATGIAFNRITGSSANSIFAPVCGVATDGAGACWGPNNQGQLGTSSTSAQCSTANAGVFGCSGVPLTVSGNLSFAQVAPGDQFACGITTLQEVWCWGINTNSQLGQGNNIGSSAVPLLVTGGIRFAKP
jgi:alpha-tubulin suppressor-like RCC1 family protein